jgi:protein associated with RNAse G/E
MDNLWLHSTKYDGSLHYRYPVQMVGQSEKCLITYYQPGGPMQSYRGSWTGSKHLLSFFWCDRPYVLHVRWDSQWQAEFLYVDIATATSWLDGTVRYTDMDLDLILRHGATAVDLDDADEFEMHRVAWSYPQELVHGCWAAVEEVRGFLKTGKEPFTPSMFAWRPGEPVHDGIL